MWTIRYKRLQKSSTRWCLETHFYSEICGIIGSGYGLALVWQQKENVTWETLASSKCISLTLQWRSNERDGISNHQPHDCLLNRLFMRRSKKTSKLRVTGLCEGNSPVTGEFPAQIDNNAEKVSIWWRHHDKITRDTVHYRRRFWSLWYFNGPSIFGRQFWLQCLFELYFVVKLENNNNCENIVILLWIHGLQVFSV